MTTRDLGALEKRLEQEPDNLPLRVTVAGHLRDVGRKADAVELYRSVALAYRGQGRSQQAIAVCRSILELAPEDAACHALLAQLASPPAPPERDPEAHPTARFETHTPLPQPVPYHVHEPTASVQRVARDDLPAVEGADTRPGADERTSDTTGLAEAARQISGLITGDQLPLSRGSVMRISASDTEPIHRDTPDFDEAPTPPPTRPTPAPAPPHGDEDVTAPRSRVALPPTENAFFAPLEVAERDAVLARCIERTLLTGELAIRQGEASHPLLLVVSGRLEARALVRGNATIALESIEAGEYIGEAALLAHAPAPATVIAMVDTVVLGVSAHVLFELAGAHPALWAALKDMAERRTRLYERLIRASP